MGGALADPCRSYPSIFRRGTIFDRFPYLLPNLICTIILACGVAIGILFLEETHEEKKHRKDIGLKIGEWILSKFRIASGHPVDGFSKASEANLYEVQSLLKEDEQPPGYRSTEGSPRPPVSRVPLLESKHQAASIAPDTSRKRPSLMDALSKQVVLIIIGYGILA